MRLEWRPGALEDLGAAAEWSERQAGAVVEAVEWMADTGWHSLGRRVRRGNARVWPVAPLAIVYGVAGDALVVYRIIDMRRMRVRL